MASEIQIKIAINKTTKISINLKCPFFLFFRFIISLYKSFMIKSRKHSENALNSPFSCNLSKLWYTYKVEIETDQF